MKEYIQINTDFINKIVLENTCTICGVVDITYRAVYSHPPPKICDDCQTKIDRQNRIDEVLK